MQAKIVLDEAYEMEYDIYNHGVQDPSHPDPLRLIGYHPKEDCYKDSLFKDWVMKYLNAGIKDTFNLSIKEWMAMPMDRALELIDIAMEHIDRKTKAIDDLERAKKGKKQLQ